MQLATASLPITLTMHKCMQLEHVIFVRKEHQEPLQMDYRVTYCFNCEKQVFYRAEFAQVVDPALITEPLLRFQCAPSLACMSQR